MTAGPWSWAQITCMSVGGGDTVSVVGWWEDILGRMVHAQARGWAELGRCVDSSSSMGIGQDMPCYAAVLGNTGRILGVLDGRAVRKDPCEYRREHRHTDLVPLYPQFDKFGLCEMVWQVRWPLPPVHCWWWNEAPSLG